MRSSWRPDTTYPTELDVMMELDPIVDLQCGGWSTTVLTIKGELYMTGLMNGVLNPWFMTDEEEKSLRRLAYPAVYAAIAAAKGDDPVPDTTIAQFSSGRSHVLGLADSGMIWLWTSKIDPARHIQFVGFDMADSHLPRATRVVAGWNRSSAYFPGKGIVVWAPAVIIDDRQEVNALGDVFFVDAKPVPDTGYVRPRGNNARDSLRDSHDGIGNTIGQVVNHVILEGFLVYLTDLGKVFAAIIDPSEHTAARGSIELAGFEPSTTDRSKMSEITGSFRNFAVFNVDGDIVVGDTDLLIRSFEAREANNKISISDDEYPKASRPAEIQNRGIISLAFGDWHRMALTASGHILAFGEETSSSQGRLGLGSAGKTRLRGDTSKGRRIWFSAEQHEWLRHLAGDLDTQFRYGFLVPGSRTFNLPSKLGDWIDAVGADWDMHPNLDSPDQTWGQGQPAYMALKVSAAGWHSGALVLVNRDRVDRLYRAHKKFLPPQNTKHYFEWGWHLLDLDDSGSDSVPPLGPEMAVRARHAGFRHAYYHSDRQAAELERSLPPEALHPMTLPDRTTLSSWEFQGQG
ncbi:MAG: hypothetical protein M1825_006320 [Sarcosagium campestre]|nr:MAG: hypothetical protein M1825_006320 [Sarcosagium campestre]